MIVSSDSPAAQPPHHLTTCRFHGCLWWMYLSCAPPRRKQCPVLCILQAQLHWQQCSRAIGTQSCPFFCRSRFCRNLWKGCLSKSIFSKATRAYRPLCVSSFFAIFIGTKRISLKQFAFLPKSVSSPMARESFRSWDMSSLVTSENINDGLYSRAFSRHTFFQADMLNSILGSWPITKGTKICVRARLWRHSTTESSGTNSYLAAAVKRSSTRTYL